MLEAFKKTQNKPAQQQAAELQALIATSKEERAALSTMLTQIQLQASKLATAGKNLQDVEELVTKANARLDQVSQRLDTAETRSRELAAIDARIGTLTDGVFRAEQEAARLTSPDGELQQHRLAIEQLAARAVEARETLEALKEEHADVERIRTDVKEVTRDAGDIAKRAGVLQADIDQLRAASAALTAELAQMQQTSADTRTHAAASAEAVQEVQRRLGSLSQLEETGRLAEERLTALNALAEHTGQKIKALENQKHTVERAVVESNRLNEMIWNMEVQTKKLEDAARQTTTTEELVERVEKMARDVGGQLDSGVRAREEFVAEIQRLEQSRSATAELVRVQTDRLALERRELAGFDERVRLLQSSIEGLEKGMQGLAARDTEVAALGAKVEQLTRDLRIAGERADGVLASQGAVEELQQALSQVNELARATGARYESLTASRHHVDQVRAEFEKVHTLYSEAARLRESMSGERSQLEIFLERTTAFAAGLPDLQSRIDAISSRFTSLDDTSRKAEALTALVSQLEERSTRLSGQRQILDQLDARLTSLGTLAADTDRRLEEQHARRGDLDAIRSRIDGVSLKAAEAIQKLEDVTAAQARLSPAAEQVTRLLSEIDRAHERLAALKIANDDVTTQEGRLIDILARSETAANAASAQVAQMHNLAEELERSAAVKDGLLAELARVEAKQLEVAMQAREAQNQLQALEANAKDTDQRRRQIAAADKRLGAFQARLDELHNATSQVERRMEQLAERETVVQAVRQQVDAVHEISAKSRADLEFVESHRNDVSTLRERVDELLGAIAETETRLASIQGRRQLVDEVQVKTSVILNMLEDVRLNVETLGEQRAVMDHALESCSRLAEMVRDAQSTMKALQSEREVAERIQRGIKQLKARTPAPIEKRKPA
jgi:chromosome segregation ATPase